MLNNVHNAPLPCQLEISDSEDPDFTEIVAEEQCAEVGKNQGLVEVHTLYEILFRALDMHTSSYIPSHSFS